MRAFLFLFLILFEVFSFLKIDFIEKDQDPIIGNWRVISVGFKLVDDSIGEVWDFEYCDQKNYVTYYKEGSLKWNIHKIDDENKCKPLADDYLIGYWANTSWAKYDIKYISRDKKLEEKYNRVSDDLYYWSSTLDTMKVVRFFNQRNQSLKPKDVAVESTIYVRIKK